MSGVTPHARQPRPSLKDATADGAGTGVSVSGYSTIAMQVIEDTVTAGVATLELSLDGSNWHTTSVSYDASTDSSGDMVWSVDTPANWARASLASFSGTSITALISGA